MHTPVLKQIREQDWSWPRWFPWWSKEGLRRFPPLTSPFNIAVGHNEGSHQSQQNRRSSYHLSCPAGTKHQSYGIHIAEKIFNPGHLSQKRVGSAGFRQLKKFPGLRCGRPVFYLHMETSLMPMPPIHYWWGKWNSEEQIFPSPIG